MSAKIPQSKWKWFGLSGHFICGRWCRFHLCTQVGPWLVSTVGQYVHPRHSGASEKAESDWMQKNPHGEEIGCGRTYETMVFQIGSMCSCGCGQPNVSGSEEDFEGYNDMKAAREGHQRMCEKWATRAAGKQGAAS